MLRNAWAIWAVSLALVSTCAAQTPPPMPASGPQADQLGSSPPSAPLVAGTTGASAPHEPPLLTMGKLTTSFVAHELDSWCFSPSGEWVVHRRGKPITVLNTQTQKEIELADSSDLAMWSDGASSAFNSDSNYFLLEYPAYPNAMISSWRIYDTRTGKVAWERKWEKGEKEHQESSVFWGADPSEFTVCTATRTKTDVAVLHLPDKKELASFSFAGPTWIPLPNYVAAAPGAKRLLIGANHPGQVNGSPLLTLDNVAKTSRLDPSIVSVTFAMFSADGRASVVFGCAKQGSNKFQTVYRLTTPEGRQKDIPTSTARAPRRLFFSPNYDRFVAIRTAYAFCLVDVGSEKILLEDTMIDNTRPHYPISFTAPPTREGFRVHCLPVRFEADGDVLMAAYQVTGTGRVAGVSVSSVTAFDPTGTSGVTASSSHVRVEHDYRAEIWKVTFPAAATAPAR